MNSHRKIPTNIAGTVLVGPAERQKAMATELRNGQKLSRQIKVYGVEGPVNVTLTSEGIEFKIKGSKVGVSAPWPQVIDGCNTPDNVPSKLHDMPVPFLQDSARRIQASLIKRLDKE